MSIISYEALQVERCSHCETEMDETIGQNTLSYLCPECGSSKTINKVDKKEYCPKCHKELTVDSFPPYEYPEGGGGQGSVLQCEHCNYTTSIMFD